MKLTQKQFVKWVRKQMGETSIRAYAKQIGMSRTTVHHVLSGTVPASAKFAQSVGANRIPLTKYQYEVAE